MAGVEVVSPPLERQRLIEKSGQEAELSEALAEAQRAVDVEKAQLARERLRELVPCGWEVIVSYKDLEVNLRSGSLFNWRARVVGLIYMIYCMYI